MRKKLVAIRANVASLTGERRVFLTFTHAEALEPDEYRKRWNHLLTVIRRRFPEFNGVRVHEQFPGRWNEFSHGIHTHVLASYICRKALRRCCSACGWGRLGYEVVTETTAAEDYLAKYLAPRDRPECLKGWRLYAKFGLPQGTRLMDVFKFSLLSEAWARCSFMPDFASLGFYAKSQFAAQHLYHMICEGTCSYQFLEKKFTNTLDSSKNPV